MQVFVDPSRRRLPWLRRGGHGLSALAAGYVGLVIVALLGAGVPLFIEAEAAEQPRRSLRPAGADAPPALANRSAARPPGVRLAAKSVPERPPPASLAAALRRSLGPTALTAGAANGRTVVGPGMKVSGRQNRAPAGKSSVGKGPGKGNGTPPGHGKTHGDKDKDPGGDKDKEKDKDEKGTPPGTKASGKRRGGSQSGMSGTSRRRG